MSARNRDLSAARAWAHDAVCASGEACAGDNDHARRTQGRFARDFVNATDVAGRARAVHELLCIGAMRGECSDTNHETRSAEMVDAVLTERVQP